MKKTIKLIFLTAIVAVGLTSCWEDVSEIQGSGVIADAGLKLTVLNSSGTGVAGANVELYTSSADLMSGANALTTATTGSDGSVSFGSDVLGNEPIEVFVSAYTTGFAEVSWDVATTLGTIMMTSGQANMFLGTAAPAYSSSVTGALDTMEVISGTSHSFSVANYPGTYSWSSSSASVTFDDASSSAVTASFVSNEVADETMTISVDINAGSSQTTLSFVVTSTQFCPVADLTTLAGNYTGTDGHDYYYGDAVVTISANDDGTLGVYGLNHDWMAAAWGETVYDGYAPAIMEVDAGLGITIAEQTYFTTLYDGADYVYTVYGSGVIDGCTGTITLYYDVATPGYDEGLAVWFNDNGYAADNIFTVTLTPAD
jgi:hypothetical protein